MADSDAATRERKFPVKRTIGLVFNSLYFDPSTVAALYKFDIDISSSGHDDNVIVQSEDGNMYLDPIATFFKHDHLHQIDHVSCGIIGSKLFLFPNELLKPSIESFITYFPEQGTGFPDLITSSLARIQPLQFDFKNNQTDTLTKCHQKVRPFVIPIHDKIYLLSVTKGSSDILEPAFEVYDPTTGSLEPLPRPPFYDEETPFCDILGYAVFTRPYKHGAFIIIMGIFCEDDDETTASNGFFSYNLQTCAWKRVSVPEGAYYSYWEGETVVVEGYLYSYSSATNKLEYCAIQYREETDDFLLGVQFEVEGLRMRDAPEQFADGIETGGIAYIGDRMLCVVYTGFPQELDWQYVLASIIQIRKDDPSCCETLSSLMFGLPNLSEVHTRNSLMLTSCFALAPDVTSSIEQIEGGRDRKRRLVQYIIEQKL